MVQLFQIMQADTVLQGLVLMEGYCVISLTVLTSLDVIFIYVTITARITGLLPGSLLGKALVITRVSAATVLHIQRYQQITVAYIQKLCIMCRWIRIMRYGS